MILGSTWKRRRTEWTWYLKPYARRTKAITHARPPSEDKKSRRKSPSPSSVSVRQPTRARNIHEAYFRRLAVSKMLFRIRFSRAAQFRGDGRGPIRHRRIRFHDSMRRRGRSRSHDDVESSWTISSTM